MANVEDAELWSRLRRRKVVQWEPGFPAFRSSPGFKQVVERMGLQRYWREHGFPPQCRPVGADDFTRN
jgi:hypothetical protein